MAQRTIDTLLRVQNEGDYKTAIRNCSSELKVMKSELDKVTSEFRTNANSMEALTKKGEVLSRMYTAQKQKVELLRGAMTKAQDTRDEEERTLADLRERYEQAQKTLTSYGDEVDKTSAEYQQQKAEVDKLRDATIQHEAKLKSSASSYTYYATQLNKAEVELDRLSDQQEENKRLMEEARQSADGCATSIDRYGDAVKQSADGTGQASSAVEVLATAMVASGVQQNVEDLAAAMMECSEASQEYELSLAQVSTIADESVVSSKEMQEGVLQLSTQLRKDANEVSDAVYNALSAGVETADVLEFTAQSSQLATAGFTDMGTSVDVLTTILNAYKLESSQTEKVASTLVKTQDLGKITVDQLGKVIGRVIPSAAAYGVNLDNIAAAYANMTAAGINAENSTTYLSTMLDELADSGSSVAGVLQEQTGKSFARLMAEGKSLGDVLEIIGASVEYDNVQFSNLWSSATAGKAAISLFDGSAESFNRTLDQMANSSGTVAKNYEKMADVSDYSSQRLAVASKNLQIAVGDQLNPVLDELREAGGAVLEKVTEIVQEHPAIMSVISGLVTGLGLLAGGVSALMIAKSAAAAMNALNISLAANPAVLVTTAVVGLVAALGTFIAQIETTEEKVDALTESASGLSETIAAGNTAYEDTVVSTEAAANMVGQYIDRLEQLERQGLNTEAKQLEYSMTLDKINALMPGLNAELDAQTGLVKDGADSLREQADAWKENALAEAAYTRYKDDVAALADAEYELAKNQAQLSILQREGQPATDRLAEVTRELSDAQDHLNDLTVAGSSYLGYTSKEQAEAQRRVSELEAEYQSLNQQVVENQSQQSILKLAIEEGSQAVSSATAEVEAADAAYQQMSQGMQDASTDTGDAVADMADAVAEANQKVKDAYAEMYASARDSLDKQIGLFDDLSGKSEMSMDKMIENLKSQQTAFNNYADNLQLAMERGIDKGLVQKLSDGTAESMQILEVLVNGTDEEIAELNEVLGGVGISKDRAADAMAGLSEAVEEAMAEAETAAIEGGKNVAEGAAAGVRAATKSYERAITNMAQSGTLAYQRTNEIKSPSRKYRWLANQDVQGLIVQYQEDTPKLQKSVTQMADTGYLAQIRARQAAIPSFASAAATVTQSSDNTGLYVLLRQILTKLQEGQRLVLYPDVLIGRTAGGYDEEFGRTKILTDRGVY